jgi:hypothetical protein
MDKFTKAVMVSTIAMSSLAALVASRRAKAQEAKIQPFIATEIWTDTYRPDNGSVAPPFPHATYKLVVVRADGSIATMTRWPYAATDLFTRDVDDATTKHEFTSDDVTQSLVEGEFHDFTDVLHPASACEGISAGQMQGFDVTYKEETDSSAFRGPNVTQVHKEWLAAKLGCYPIKNELIHFHGTNAVEDVVKELANIHLGDPDPQYFAVPTNYATRTPGAWQALFAAAEAKALKASSPQ